MQNIGLVLTCFNRPAELERVLIDLSNSDLHIEGYNILLVIIDDASSDNKTVELINNFNPKQKYIKIFHNQNIQIYNILKEGFDLCVDKGCNILVNLDSDVILKPFWLKALLRLYEMFPYNLISGFNTMAHLVQEVNKFHKDGYCVKSASGGINILFSKDTYIKYVRPSFDKELGWDNGIDKQIKWIITMPSVIQHNGYHSTISKDGTNVSVASDFNNFDYLWNLC